VRDIEDRIVCAVVAVVCAIPVIAALVVGESFGIAPTLGLGGMILGVLGLVARRPPDLPEARARSAARARRRGSAAG
jgi:hypothetical protein